MVQCAAVHQGKYTVSATYDILQSSNKISRIELVQNMKEAPEGRDTKIPFPGQFLFPILILCQITISRSVFSCPVNKSLCLESNFPKAKQASTQFPVYSFRTLITDRQYFEY